MREGWGMGVAGSQPMSTAVHITCIGAKRNFGDLPPYLTYFYTETKDSLHREHLQRTLIVKVLLPRSRELSCKTQKELIKKCNRADKVLEKNFRIFSLP
jgi:hypothetical protein